ncbi:MAG: hypothetical protein DWQ31_08740 [Planctomycetota bacterium]|nr:MAG: hypothetical protein DWQ31_08740 [Planctomycetota bacterium]REJ86924.1 MAG: hypothetical protein DWQ35_22430 [Planctomycetota bacterium]REK24949.1 MAG: hypothetical protein DWQ42_12740 [Planctomycetota bacterium]REK48538.1 MAG: hypothetical protein DWQ46_02270 [Planctomycetota bacterium]
MNSQRPWVVIGNPENRRVRLFQDALARHGQPAAAELSYLDLLLGRKRIDEIPHGAIVRIDSPGENFQVEKLLLAAGEAPCDAEGTPALSATEIRESDYQHGRVFNTRQWYLGFSNLLSQWRDYFRVRSDLVFALSLTDVTVMFDKCACHSRFNRANLPVPPALGIVRSFDHFILRMEEEGWERVFIKPAHASSASGVVALHRRGNRIEAITSALMVEDGKGTRLYNSLKLQRYTDLGDVRELVETLIPHRVHVEKWMPKASLQRRVLDLRVVMLAGDPRHMVARTSRSPLTNLHLGNRRGDLDELRAKVPEMAWEEAMRTCSDAAACFPNSLQFSLDLLFTPGFRAHYLLEANAFGDLLPGVLNRGFDTYEAEVEAILDAVIAD